jgi:hypothetical protein
VVEALHDPLRFPTLVLRVHYPLEQAPRRVREEAEGDHKDQAPPERREQYRAQRAILAGGLISPSERGLQRQPPDQHVDQPVGQVAHAREAFYPGAHLSGRHLGVLFDRRTVLRQSRLSLPYELCDHTLHRAAGRVLAADSKPRSVVIMPSSGRGRR